MSLGLRVRVSLGRCVRVSPTTAGKITRLVRALASIWRIVTMILRSSAAGAKGARPNPYTPRDPHGPNRQPDQLYGSERNYRLVPKSCSTACMTVTLKFFSS